jgi:hypothetical protein
MPLSRCLLVGGDGDGDAAPEEEWRLEWKKSDDGIRKQR